jgi:hypothetical protein
VPDTVDLIQGIYSAADNAVIGYLPVQPYPRRVTSIVLQGPRRSTFKLYRGSKISAAMQISSTPTGGGGDNQYDTVTTGPAILIGAGEEVTGAWSGGTTGVGSIGTATLRSTY